MEEFGVSEVVATLGLSLFVLYVQHASMILLESLVSVQIETQIRRRLLHRPIEYD